METLSYWLARMEPIIRAETEGEIICVFANRSGTEDDAVYAGTSAVLGIHAGEVKVYGILGRGEKELLVVDTNKRPQAKLVSEPNSTASEENSGSKDVPNSNNAPDSKDVADSTNDPDSKTVVDLKDVQNSSEANGVSTDEPRTVMINDERTNSAISDRSDLSLNTQTTACTIPDLADTSYPTSMGDAISPLSPVDAGSPSQFFAPKGRRPEGETLRQSLKSSIGQKEFQPALPDSPTFNRPSSPKSRNASRTRMAEYQEPALKTHDLAQEEQITRHDTPGFVRPPSPKSRNASRTRDPEYQEPALVSHDLAKEEQVTNRAVGIKSPMQPQSAAAAPDRYHAGGFSPSYFGPRRSLLKARPKSTYW
jgi:hypothetical protein